MRENIVISVEVLLIAFCILMLAQATPIPAPVYRYELYLGDGEMIQPSSEPIFERNGTWMQIEWSEGLDLQTYWVTGGPISLRQIRVVEDEP